MSGKDGFGRECHAFDERARWLAHHVIPHEATLRSWLLKRPVPGLEIDDIVQETYARLSTAASVSGIRDPRNYLFRVAHSIMLTFIRRARVVPMHSFAQFDADAFIDGDPDPETVAVDRDELSKLARCLGELPPKMREVFMLRRVEGLSQREVAERLGLSESTVEKHMANGFRKIAQIFARDRGNRSAGASRHGALARKGWHAARDKRGN